MKYRIVLTDMNKLNTPFEDVDNGTYIVDVEHRPESRRVPYGVKICSTGKLALFRPNKCFWDEIDIEEQEYGASLEHNIKLIPMPVLKRKSYV